MDMDKTMIGNGRYEVGGLLGRGGMAEVRRAQDLRLGRPARARVDEVVRLAARRHPAAKET